MYVTFTLQPGFSRRMLPAFTPRHSQLEDPVLTQKALEDSDNSEEPKKTPLPFTSDDSPVSSMQYSSIRVS